MRALSATGVNAMYGSSNFSWASTSFSKSFDIITIFVSRAVGFSPLYLRQSHGFLENSKFPQEIFFGHSVLVQKLSYLGHEIFRAH